MIKTPFWYMVFAYDVWKSYKCEIGLKKLNFFMEIRPKITIFGPVTSQKAPMASFGPPG